MARLPARRFGECTPERRSVGRAGAVIAIAALFVAMLAIAPRSQGSELWMVMQVLLFVEFGGLLLWVWSRPVP